MDQLREKVDNHEGRLQTLERMAAEASEEQAKTNKSLSHLESIGKQQLKATEDLTQAVKDQGQQLLSQTTRNDLQDTELAELRTQVRGFVRDYLTEIKERAKDAGKTGGKAATVFGIIYAIFELWQKFGG